MLNPRSVILVLPMLLATLVAFGGCPCLVLAADAMIELTLKGRRLEGLPISWNEEEVHLLGRDGRLWEFKPAEASDFKKTSAQFRGYSPSEFRAELLREMGNGYEVSGTGHYLIVHPTDQRDRWAERFEDLYRSFVHYFSVRGFEPATPQFSLVGVVCRNHAEFLRHAESDRAKKSNSYEAPFGQFGTTTPDRLLLDATPSGLLKKGEFRLSVACPRLPWACFPRIHMPTASVGMPPILFQQAPSGVLGYYDVESNRINLYDMGGKTDSTNWRQNAAVLIHEATHQTAFNTGIHSRYCLPPLWLAEGLAMLFEAPGVYDSRNNGTIGDRINRDRLKAFRQGVLPHHQPKLIALIVASDDLFRIRPGAAYAEAWALTFFLAETEPRKYVEYLKRTAARPPFTDYTAAERTADFAAVFGSDWRMLEARFLRFMGGLK